MGTTRSNRGNGLRATTAPGLEGQGTWSLLRSEAVDSGNDASPRCGKWESRHMARAFRTPEIDCLLILFKDAIHVKELLRCDSCWESRSRATRTSARSFCALQGRSELPVDTE